MDDLSGIDLNKLIPKLATWNNGSGVSAESWIASVGNIEFAIAYSRLFWPEFVEHEGCVFFANFSLNGYRGFMEQCGGDRKRVQIVMNHRHVFDHFSHYAGEATDEQLIYLGRVLKDIWQTKLSVQFPDRKFTVSFPEGPFEDLLDYEVTFWQETAADQASVQL